MGLFDWFRKTTMDGRIKRELSSLDASTGKGKLQVQELEKTVNGQRAFRFNIQRSTVSSYQSLPIVLTESQVKELNQHLWSAIESNGQHPK